MIAVEVRFEYFAIYSILNDIVQYNCFNLNYNVCRSSGGHQQPLAMNQGSPLLGHGSGSYGVPSIQPHLLHESAPACPDSVLSELESQTQEAGNESGP